MADVKQILPPSEERARAYQTKNFTEVKTLLSTGEVIEGLPVLVTNPTGASQYSLRADETSEENVIYKGEAAIGSSESDAVWRIQRVDMTTGITKILWANGNSDFTNKWTERIGSIFYS